MYFRKPPVDPLTTFELASNPKNPTVAQALPLPKERKGWRKGHPESESTASYPTGGRPMPLTSHAFRV